MWRRTAIVTVLDVAVTSAQQRDFRLSPANIVQKNHLMSKQNSLPDVDHVVRLPQCGIGGTFRAVHSVDRGTFRLPPQGTETLSICCPENGRTEIIAS